MTEQSNMPNSGNNPGKKSGGSLFDTMPSKFSFWAGVVAATAVISIIGFAVLATLMFKGVDVSAGEKDTNTEVAAEEGTGSGTTASDSVDMDALRNLQGKGDYTIVVFTDIECPFCKRFHGTMQQVMDEYDGKVRWAQFHFPLVNLHPAAPRRAEAAECAAEQGKFWEYMDELMEGSSDETGDEELSSVAANVGLDTSQFEDCLDTGKYEDRVSADASLAQKLGGTGTPYSVIVDKDGKVVEVISGAQKFETIAAALDQLTK
ncbi:DsbA family protein [Patescibacteria group bacterium]